LHPFFPPKFRGHESHAPLKWLTDRTFAVRLVAITGIAVAIAVTGMIFAIPLNAKGFLQHIIFDFAFQNGTLLSLIFVPFGFQGTS
jgi:hypothetical protein